MSVNDRSISDLAMLATLMNEHYTHESMPLKKKCFETCLRYIASIAKREGIETEFLSYTLLHKTHMETVGAVLSGMSESEIREVAESFGMDDYLEGKR